MLYRCRTLLPMSGPPVANAALVVRGDTIAAVGSWAEVRRDFGGEPVTDLGEQIVLPGLINAHCHLDYSLMRGAIEPDDSFATWVGRINALKRASSDADFLRAIAAGFAEARRFGTTTLVNVESFPALLSRLPQPPPLRTWWCLEMMDLREPVEVEAIAAMTQKFFSTHPSWLGGFGLSPHAPYTASADLYRATREVACRRGIPWTTHLAESRDEEAMFRDARGPLHDFLATLGRPMDDCGQGRSALETLTAGGALGPECLAVHLNTLGPRDFALLAPGAPLHGLNVVHCPQSHRYFGHPPFLTERLRHESAINLCLGTDSLASSPSLSLFDEMRAFAAEAGADLNALELLKTVTLNPARALGQTGRLGCIQPGACADLIALPDDDENSATASEETLCEKIVSHHASVDWMLVAGNPGR